MKNTGTWLMFAIAAWNISVVISLKVFILIQYSILIQLIRNAYISISSFLSSSLNLVAFAANFVSGEEARQTNRVQKVRIPNGTKQTERLQLGCYSNMYIEADIKDKNVVELPREIPGIRKRYWDNLHHITAEVWPLSNDNQIIPAGSYTANLFTMPK